MLLPGVIKNWLEKNRGYLRWRYSAPIINAWLVFRPAVKRQLNRQRKLYLDVLRGMEKSPATVFDIGANEGHITNILLQTRYHVVAVEPAPRNLAILHARFDNVREVTILPVAAAAISGTIDFFESSQHALGTASVKWNQVNDKKNRTTGGSPSSRKTDAMSLDDMIGQYGKPLFVKIDVEGYEADVLRGLSTPVPLLSFEAILPLFLAETIECINRMYALKKDTRFNYAVDDRMQWPDFRSRDELLEVLNLLPPQTLEIFCKG